MERAIGETYSRADCVSRTIFLWRSRGGSDRLAEVARPAVLLRIPTFQPASRVSLALLLMAEAPISKTRLQSITENKLMLEQRSLSRNSPRIKRSNQRS